MSITCPCSMPPGGQITCEDDQMAICGVVDGQLIAGCFDKPHSAQRIEDKAQRDEAILQWGLQKILGKSYQKGPVTNEQRDILRAGVYTNPYTKHEVSFRVPVDVDIDPVVSAGSGLRYR